MTLRSDATERKSSERERDGLLAVKPIISIRWVLFVVLAPFMVLGFVALSMQIYGLIRHDPSYFTEPYLEKYSTPGDAARALEQALQTGDQEFLAELQGLRWMAKFETAPSMIFVMLWERTDRYITYLYFDMQTYERQPHYFEEVNGRWVVSPADIYYYMRSGKWQGVFMPLAIFWWLAGGVAIGLVVLARISERFRARLYGE